MARQDLLKLLNRPVVVEIVEVVERGQVQRIMRTEGKRVAEAACGGAASGWPERNQRAQQKQGGALDAGKGKGFSVKGVRVR